MPRKPRFYLPGVPVHVVQRGHNRQAIFFEHGDYTTYLGYLKEGIKRYDCELHAYVLMTNHVHLLVTPQEKESISQLAQYIGRQYVPYINFIYGRSGTLWEGRHKGSLVQSEAYLLNCMRYIELNPVRAKMVEKPEDYPWSSYMANAYAVENDLISPQGSYLDLSKIRQDRVLSYRALFEEPMSGRMLSDIRQAWQTGTPLGNDRFRQQIEEILKVRVGRTRRGRHSEKDTYGF